MRAARSMTPARIMGLAGLLACLCLPARAADPKPDATVKNASIEANVYLDDKIKADSALAADCLAEGRKWIDKNAAEAASARKDEPELFKDRGGYSFERKYSVRSIVDGRYVSVLRDDYMDSHGAHPNTDVNTILWDATAKKRISIRPFFTETADNGPTLTVMRKAVVSALNAEKKKRGAGETATADWYKELKPTLLKIGAVTLAPSTEAGKSSGLTFHYPPYAVGPYAEGQYVVFVPWETLKPYLTPDGARIFASARPKADADDQQQ
ncbi:RsiV family protein [Bradyrhizobium sp. Pha-3]|uniref:RsiV family protein n=1 Tax=Bradyrhizobium sp. Pha-3 TaxID=208375 RepID=UPI0035D4BBB4